MIADVELREAGVVDLASRVVPGVPVFEYAANECCVVAPCDCAAEVEAGRRAVAISVEVHRDPAGSEHGRDDEGVADFLVDTGRNATAAVRPVSEPGAALAFRDSFLSLFVTNAPS